MNGIDDADKLAIMYLIPTYVLIVVFVLTKVCFYSSLLFILVTHLSEAIITEVFSQFIYNLYNRSYILKP